MGRSVIQTNSVDVGADWGERTIMFAGGLLPALALIALSSVLPKIDAALAHSSFDSFLVKQLVGAVGFAMVVGAALAGFLANRLGLRIILIAALLIYVVAGTAGLYIGDLRVLLVSRLGVGVAAAAIQIMSMTLISTRTSGQDRAKWMGRHIAIAMIGTILVHPVVGVLGELGWRWPFTIYAGGLLLLPAALQMKSLQTHQKQARESGQRRVFLSASKLLESISWFPRRYLPIAMTMGSIAYLPIVYSPYLLREIGVSSSAVMAMVLTADSLAAATMALLYGRARHYLSHYAVFVSSLACAGLGALLAETASGIAGVVTGLLVFGLGVGWFVPNLMTALAANVSQQHQGSAIGLIKATHFLAAPISIALAEPLARAYGPSGVMLVVASLAFCASLGFVVGARCENNKTKAVMWRSI